MAGGLMKGEETVGPEAIAPWMHEVVEGKGAEMI